ncbi:MAG: cytochrome C [Ignavibacteriaceae bacterium]
MTIKHFYILVFTGLMLFLTFSAFFSKAPVDSMLEGNSKLINFSHQIHSDLAECADCHSAVEESTTLTDRLLPNHEDCGNCHEVDNEEECGLCHVNDNYEALVQTKSELIFNHKQHISEELQCTNCHKDFTSIAYSDEAEQKVPPMELCSSCHNPVAKGPEFCESCHISTVNLIPQNHITANFTREHKFLARSFDANCAMCHDNSTCEECHVSTNVITELNTPDDFYQPYVPSQGIDGTKQQIIERVHELDYRFIHGIDANLKVDECQTCHEIQSFCANCHQSEIADFSLGGVAPLSHIDPNFKTFGVGSGGGEHAILAQRNIESCTACHDIQGADPTCITCHLDSDGIQGTDPKTHASGFMNDNDGSWHTDMGSICYNCHTSASPQSSKSAGFCNYCHGL